MKLTTKYRKCSELIEADYNPRQLTEKQHDDLKASIEKFGVVDPLIVNMHEGRENVIIEAASVKP